MNAAIELYHVGKRNAPPPTYILIPDGCDPQVALAEYLEARHTAGAWIVGSHGNPGVFAVCDMPCLPWHQGVLRVRIVDLCDVDTQELKVS